MIPLKRLPRTENKGKQEVSKWKWVQRHAGKDMEKKIKEKLEKKRAKKKEEEK